MPKFPLEIILQKKKIFLFLISCLFIFILINIFRWSNSQTTDNAYVESDISSVSSEIDGLISKVLLIENSEVQEGDIIAEIKDEEYKIQLAKAESLVEIANGKIQISNQKIALEKIKLEKLNAAIKLAKDDYDRTIDLKKGNISSQQTLDIVQEKYVQAKLDLESTQQNQAILEIEKKIQETELSSLTQDKNLAQRNLDNTKIRSPITGRIGSSGLRVGNYISRGNIVCSVVPANLYIKANFKETQITKFKEGMRVELNFDYLSGRKFYGKIRTIAPATGSKFSLLPMDNATGNFTKIVQRVTITIDIDDCTKCKRLMPGMSAHVLVRT